MSSSPACLRGSPFFEAALRRKPRGAPCRPRCRSLPGSHYLSAVELGSAADVAIWEYAKAKELVLVTKDKDFANLSMVWGAPPKVVLLQTGNSSTALIESVIRSNSHPPIRIRARCEAEPSNSQVSARCRTVRCATTSISLCLRLLRQFQFDIEHGIVRRRPNDDFALLTLADEIPPRSVGFTPIGMVLTNARVNRVAAIEVGTNADKTSPLIRPLQNKILLCGRCSPKLPVVLTTTTCPLRPRPGCRDPQPRQGSEPIKSKYEKDEEAADQPTSLPPPS